MRNTLIVATLAAGLALPSLAEAQGGPGFLFSRPKVSLGFRAGYTLPRAESNIFDTSLDLFTLSKSDFGSPYLGGELALRASERWDVVLTLGWARSTSRSEYRDWEDQDGLPIEQETRFQTVSGALGAKYYFQDRGRTIGRFVWVPRRLTPFVSAGLGVTGYEFEQAGSFIDFDTPDNEVFVDRLRTTGSGLAAYASAGADLSLAKQLFLTGEARYNFGSGGVGGGYAAFDRIDLSGLQLMGGIALRF